MITCAKEWCERLNIPYNERVEPFYKRGVELLEKHGDMAFNIDRLNHFNDKYNIFRKHYAAVLECAEQLHSDEDLALFVYVLAAFYEQDTTPVINENGVNIRRLDAPDRGRLDTDMAPLFSSLYFLEDMVGEMERRGMPHNIISDSLYGMDVEMDDYIGIYGRVGMRRYISWYLNWVKCRLYRIGRFMFKPASFNVPVRVYRKGDHVLPLIDGRVMHKKGMVFGSKGQTNEDESYLASITEADGAVIGYTSNEYGECIPTPVKLEGYEEVFRGGDMIIEVHIPAAEPLTPDICLASYEQAKAFFKKCYPEYDFKAITCQSWMVEKRLKDLLDKETNLTKFMDEYTAYPIKSSGDGIYSFVYNLHQPIPPEQLPEDTSVRRAIKKYLLDGNYFYEKGGFILI